MTTSFKRIQILTDLLKKHNIRNIVFSPGSRNAPLVLAFKSDSFFNSKVIVDERSAAFIALGMSQQLQEPVIICCTSGSATLNYSPAICEAFYQRIPLLILTADRPPEWIDQGEGQSINQNSIYNNYVGGSFQFPVDENKDTLWQSGRITNEAVNLCKTTSLPVHINLPFREPLYNTSEALISKRKVHQTTTEKKISNHEWIDIIEQWKNYSKKLIICGQLNKNKKLNELIKRLSKEENTVVLTETTSNISDTTFINSIDKILERVDENEEFIPELIISIGGAIVSKKIKTLFRKHNPKEHWCISESTSPMDVFTSLTRVIPINPEQFFSALLQKINSGSSDNFQKKWLNENSIAEQNHSTFLKKAPWSDLKAHEIISKQIPENTHVQLGNSTSIRYAQLFTFSQNLHFFGNRGVSGIDGSTSTAIGAAIASKKETLLITGDLSFVYDNNAFWNNYVPHNLKVIVLNNNGGDIFNIIPGASETEYCDENFVSNNSSSIELLSKAHGIDFMKASSAIELEDVLPVLFKSKKATLLEIDTKTCKNSEVLNAYFKEIKS